MTDRATFDQIAPPAFFARCRLCGVMVDPSDLGRGLHIEYHEWITSVETSARVLIDTIQRRPGQVLDLTAEEARQRIDEATT